MKLRDIFLNPDERMVLTACERLFNDICAEEGTAAQVVYTQFPRERERAWLEIRQQVLSIMQFDGVARTKLLRTEMAKAIEHCATAHFYTNLDQADRDVVARYIFSSTREVQDNFYYYNHAYSLALAHVLTQMFYLGWTESDKAKDAVRDVQKVFQEQCKEHCQLVLKVAHAKHDERELADADKKSAEMVVMMKELARRALQGEAIE
jgi:hypothetical protein